MKKKVSVIVTAVTLVSLIVVGSTLAFFTTQTTVNNVVTMGNVQISLAEPNFKNSGFVVPGQFIVKDPTVTNTGSNTAYIRCKLELVVPEAENSDHLPDARLTDYRRQQLLNGISFGDAAIPGSAAKWILANDGYYYYQGKLAKNESVEFFNSVTIPKDWDNKLSDKEFSINVSAEAIQTDNYNPAGPDGTITSWNYSDGTKVAVETSSPPV